jgi:hypothetical protein
VEVVAIDNKKLLRYSIQLSMLKQLLIKHLIDDREYKRILVVLMRDYGVISDLKPCLIYRIILYLS